MLLEITEKSIEYINKNNALFVHVGEVASARWQNRKPQPLLAHRNVGFTISPGPKYLHEDSRSS